MISCAICGKNSLDSSDKKKAFGKMNRNKHHSYENYTTCTYRSVIHHANNDNLRSWKIYA